MGYKSTIIRGIGWIGILQIFVRSLSFLKIFIAAKILSPQEMGLYGATILVLSLSEVFTETGMQTFLIQHKKVTERVIGTVWIVILLRGVLLFLIIVILAYPTALFFKQDSLFLLILFVSLIPLIKSLENPLTVTFQKQLLFNREFYYRLVYVIFDVTLSIILVLLFRDVHALIFALILSTFVGVVTSWIFLKKRPKLFFSKSVLKEIGRFIKSIVPMNIANYLASQSDYIFIGRVLGIQQLGIYQVTQRLSSQPLIELSDVFGKVTLPVYTKLTYSKKRLKRAYLRLLAGLIVASFFLGTGLVIFSYYFINFLGDSWKTGLQLYPILIAYGVFFAAWGSIGSLFFSLQQHVVLKKLSVIRFFITIPLIIVFGLLWGTEGVALGMLFGIVILLPITIIYVIKFFSEKKILKNRR